MKALSALLLLASAAPASPVMAGPSPQATAPHAHSHASHSHAAHSHGSPSPLLGRWAVDVSRLEMPPEKRPKSVTITYSDAGGGKWRTNVEIVAPDGSKSGSTSVYALDGAPVPVTGDLWADTAAVKRPEANVMILLLAKGSEPASTRVYTVAPNGRTMIETAAYFAKDGKPILRTSHFNRVE